ncbi:MAG: hypothetical protein A2020_15395 [Lentisphaerae bacterium GWF2_45_14]|nr:MAG: hypothetical protein A2020_15395 [Lentisphaerae bacterium GWF2_45_14]
MSSKLIAGTVIVLVPAFIVYMTSESLLREAAIAGINPEQVNSETILKELPSQIRDSINYSVMLSQFKDSVANASTPAEKANALCTLADYTTDIKEKEDLFEKVIKKYSTQKESANAYFYFFNKQGPKVVKIGIPELQKYILQFSFLDQFSLWGLALAQLKSENIPESKQLEFLIPLLYIEPNFRDYTALYEKIAYFASRQSKSALYDKARKCEEKCLKYPFIETVLMKELIKTKGQEK